MALLYYYDQNPFHVFFLNLVIPARSKVLICTKKRNPEDSGRSSKLLIYLCLNAAKRNETKDKWFLEFPSTGAFVGSVF